MKSKMLMILLVCFVMMATVAVAKEPTMTRIDPADLQDLTILTPPADGLVGNAYNPIAHSIPDWLVGDEAYKYLINPSADLPNCPVGFQLLSIGMVLEFPADLPDPYFFFAYGDLETAVWDEVLGCYVPGAEECTGPLTTFFVGPGTWVIELPMPECACAYIYGPGGVPYMYMLSVHFVGPVTANLVTDEFPVGCTSWNNKGDGWVDLVNDSNFPGELIIYGDVNCCDEPVATEEKSWGDVKSLFR